MKKLFFFAGLFLLLSPVVFADAASIGGSGNTVKILDDEQIQMVSEVIDIDIYDGDRESDLGGISGGYVEVEVTYDFKNLTDEAVTVTMGFPEDCGYSCYMDEEGWESWGDQLFESYKLFDFVASEDGDEFDVEFRNYEDAVTEGVNWYIYEVSFGSGEEKEIVNSYWMAPSSYKIGQWFDYMMRTGASWAGVIEDVDVNINFHGDLSIYDVVELSPEGYKFDGDTLKWHFDDLEPDSDNDNLSIRYLPVSYGHGCYEESSELASSYLPDEEIDGEYYVYGPFHVADGFLGYSWVEGVSGDGIGEWVKVCLNEDKEYYNFDIFAGYGDDEDSFWKNNRVKKGEVSFPNGYSQEFELSDTYDFQTVVLDESVSGVDHAIIEIRDVYEGLEYDDTAIAEVQFKGLLIAGVLGEETVFSDVYDSHPNVDAILYLKDIDVIDGYPDGTFKPNGSINRAELMKMVVEMMVGDPSGLGNYGNCFPDVGSEWFAPHVCYAYEQGWVDGYPDGTFGPANLTNRAEAIKIILNAYFDGDIPELDDGEDVPNDADENAWYYSYLEYAALAGVLDLQHAEDVSAGYNYFPGGEMTRKEVAEMIYRLMEM